MEEDSKTTVSQTTSSSASEAGNNCPTPEVSPVENQSGGSESSNTHSPQNGKVIPNCVCVGRPDCKTTSSSASEAGNNCPTPEVSPVENQSGDSESSNTHSPENGRVIPNCVCVGGPDCKTPSSSASEAGDTPEGSPVENQSGGSESSNSNSPRHGKVIPNRIFVGGLDYKVTENDIWHLFSNYGTVKEVNIVIYRSRLSKGYGFVTFEKSEDAQKLLLDPNAIYLKNKKIAIRPALCKEKDRSNVHLFGSNPMSCGPMYFTTSSGYPYTYHNGVAYFQSPRVNPVPLQWPVPPSPVMVVPQPRQPVYFQPAQPYQPRIFPNPWHWNVKPPVAPSPVLCPQTVSAQPTLPVIYNTAQPFGPMMQQSYPMYPVRAPHFVPPPDLGKNPVPSFQLHSTPEAPEPADAPAAQSPQSPQSPQLPQSRQTEV